MAEPRELRNPPITEALIDFRVLLSAPVAKEDLLPLIDILRPDFPDAQERHDVEAAFRVEQGHLVPPEARAIFQGVKLSREGGRRQVQFRNDGFTFNNVGSYIGGTALIEEALALWPHYVAAARPKCVTRLAMRYINTLNNIPWRQGDAFQLFLAAPAEIPQPGPQQVSEFLSRVVAFDDVDGPRAIVTQKFSPVLGSAPVNPFQLVIDVDVFFSREIGTEVSDLRPLLDVLRSVKNRSFFSLLQEEAVKLYL